MYYDKCFLKVIALAIAKPIKFDMTTAKLDCGNFVVVCVEVDLAKPMKKKIWILNHWHETEYESLNLLCAACNCYGHFSRDCALAQAIKVGSGKPVQAPAVVKNPGSIAD